MNTTKMMRHIVVGALTSGAIAAAGLGLGTGSAAAENPKTWCPGQPPPDSGPLAVMGWDMNVCHDYWVVPFGEGNVPITVNGAPADSHIWVGSPPVRVPPPPPGPPAPGSYCATNPIGCHFFGPFGPGYS